MIFFKSSTNLGLLNIGIFRERFSRNLKMVLDEEIRLTVMLKYILVGIT